MRAPQAMFAAELRRNATDAERLLWHYLRQKQIGHQRFRRQFSIGPYIVDFVCLPARLIVEVDGGQHADSRSDVRRTSWLQSQGFVMLRFWNHEVLKSTEGVVEAIGNAVAERMMATTEPAAGTPSPIPSREGRGTRRRRRHL